MSSLAGPPRAPRRPETRLIHERRFVDPYAWMRDTDSPELIAYLQAENAWTDEALASLEPLRQELFDDLVARTQETDLSVPELLQHTDGRAFWYFSRTYEGREYPLSCRVPAFDEVTIPDATEVLPDELTLLDGNVMAEGHDFFALGVGEISPTGHLLAYSVDIAGDEEYDLRFTNVETGFEYPEVISGVAAGGAWLTDDAFCYVRTDEAWRPFQVWRHLLGTDPTTDELLYEEADARFWLALDGSRDWRWMLIAAGSKTTSEWRILDATVADAQPRIIAERRDGIEYDVDVATDRLFIVHNDGAEDFALAEAPLDAVSPEQWRPIFAGERGVRLLGVSGYDTALVASLRRGGDVIVRITPRTPGATVAWEVGHELGEPLSTTEEDPANGPAPARLRLIEESMVHPRRLVEYDLATGARRVLKTRVVRDHPIHGPYDPDAYRVERLWARAEDGVMVPLTVVRRQDVPLDGTAPCLLYGYGAYEISIGPTFGVARLSLLDRGFVFAVAHVRGGGELGRHWYLGGKLFAKRTTFTDFIASAQHLVEQGYTSADRLIAEGGSAGGLLVGAVANLAPDLFAGILADVPFVDPLTTILNPELPLTVTEWEEWGDPLHHADVYDYMASYSPYENVAARRYPAILATTSLNDTRVEVTEPAKWVSALREVALDQDERPILLKTEMVAGHGGVSGRRASWKQASFETAWIIDRAARHS
ncbi:MAG: S9 family peptidase [Propionibacteriaceae bacterium]|mgnify:CR=1 FL=1|nr:S9 family peptidase [Micropruina sp.]HBY24075.1 oligopeptidase B [Propionibacteriaceae bacterium]